MDPELQKQRGIVSTMKAQGRSYDAIVQYLRTQGYESVDAWNEAVDRADAAVAQPERQPPQRQPGMTGMAAFGADPNYFNALSGATRDVVREMAQPVTLGYADELEARARGIPYEQIAAERAAVPTPVRVAAQAPGMVLAGLGSGALTRAAIPAAASGLRSTATALGLAGAEGYLYGTGAADPGQRMEGGKTGGLTALAFGTPLVGLGHLGQYIGKQRDIAKGLIDAPDFLANEVGITPTMFAPEAGMTLAETMGPRFGGSLLRSATSGIDNPQRLKDVESFLVSRQRGVPARLGQAADVLLPGTSAGNRTGPAQAMYKTLDPQEVPENVLDALMGVERLTETSGIGTGMASRHGAKLGGYQLPNRAVEIGRDTGGVWQQPRSATWEQAMETQRGIKEMTPPLPLQKANTALREAMIEASPVYAEANELYRIGKTVELVDNAINKGNAGKVISALRAPQISQRIAADFGEEAAAGFAKLLNDGETIYDVSKRGLQGVETAGGAMTGRVYDQMKGLFTQGLTAVAYALNKMFGASARTMIQANLSGSAGGRRLANELIDILNMESTAAQGLLREASEIPGKIAKANAFRSGLLASVGGQLGSKGLLGGR